MDSPPSPDASSSEPRHDRTPSGVEESSAPTRPFLVSVDDAGQFLLIPAHQVLVGHLRNASADLPFLADLEERHACFDRRESFRAGSVWWLTALQRSRVTCNGEPVSSERPLRSGDRLRIGNVGIDFHLPDAASQTALLELHEGIECCGAQHVLLMAEGEAGRIRIGPASHGHVRLPRLELELFVGLQGERLVVSQVEAGGSSERELFSSSVPPSEWSHVSVGESVEGRPPFSLGVGPAELDRSFSLPGSESDGLETSEQGEH